MLNQCPSPVLCLANSHYIQRRGLIRITEIQIALQAGAGPSQMAS